MNEQHQAKVDEMAALAPNWDTYGAPVIDSWVLSDVALFLDEHPDITPAIVPTSHGGVTLEWHLGGEPYMEVHLDFVRDARTLYIGHGSLDIEGVSW